MANYWGQGQENRWTEDWIGLDSIASGSPLALGLFGYKPEAVSTQERGDGPDDNSQMGEGRHIQPGDKTLGSKEQSQCSLKCRLLELEPERPSEII